MDSIPHKGETMASRQDVAKQAGVSLAVVSRVLNNSGYVAHEKREKVLAVIKELRYRPHPVAVSLKTARTRQILYYVMDLSNNYFMAMYQGMVAFAAPKGYTFVLGGSLDLANVGSLMVDGMILPTEHFTRPEFLEHFRIPVVAASYCSTIPGQVAHVDADVVSALEIGFDHLWEKGHRALGFLAMDTRKMDEPRPAAFIERIRTRGVDHYEVFGPALLPGEDSGLDYCEFGVQAARQYLSGDRRCTGFVSFNDDIAIGFMSELQHAGVRIPEEVSVIGIDGHPMGKYAYPGLTTVSINPFLHGWECARVVVDLIEGREPEIPAPILGGLVLRGSTGAPRL